MTLCLSEDAFSVGQWWMLSLLALLKWPASVFPQFE